MYISVAGAWKYLYRAVDSTATIDFWLSPEWDAVAAKRFFRGPCRLPVIPVRA
jgi:transposase-like protein